MATARDAGDVDKVIAFARAQIGKPYVFGSAGPDSWDCSGLTMAAYATIGVKLAHSTYVNVTQGRAVKPVLSAMQPGDLILPHPGHIQLYIGGGRQIEAYDTGYPVREAPVSKMWRVRRVLNDGIGDLTPDTADGFSDGGVASFSNPLDILSGAGDAISWITDPHNWLRIGMFAAGALVIFIALASAIRFGKLTGKAA